MKEVITTIVFLRWNDEILLAMKKRGHGAGHWNGAGGKIEPGETIEQAMVRECQEEIGITPSVYEKVAVHSFYEPHGAEQSKLVAHAFICTEWRGEPIETEEMAPRWFAIKDIPYDTMWPDDRDWLPLVLAGKKLVGAFHYDDQNTLQSHNVTEVMELP
ncbi:MAG TPA: 8-oxo-dGTP diphosphatase [Candidatus Saccharimonadales bacterium]|nr:8-oxo-dGTP diphosphatase [Candidatus Saccharimonadales bacterium]